MIENLPEKMSQVARRKEKRQATLEELLRPIE